MNKLQKLLAISSAPVVEFQSISLLLCTHRWPALHDLQSLLDTKNGFVAFESALVVFPTRDTPSLPSVDSWNDSSGWRRWYRGFIPEEVIFFAEDLFGGQFGILHNRIVRFDPECGDLTHYAESLHAWAERVLERFPEDTGWPLAHEWQLANGPLLPTQRLLPKQPFILGGDYVVDNMTPIDRTAAMDNWGRLFQALRRVPDGQWVTVNGWLTQGP